MIEWTYDKPSEPGLYLAMYGDVETPSNADLIEVFSHHLEGLWCNFNSTPGCIMRVSAISGSYKFWKVPL